MKTLLFGEGRGGGCGVVYSLLLFLCVWLFCFLGEVGFVYMLFVVFF